MSTLLNEWRQERPTQTQAKAKAEPKKETKPKNDSKTSGAEEKSTEAKIRFNAVLPEELYEQMRETAYQNRESMNKIVITALEKYLKRSK